jgi:hypothetical protein
MARRFSGDVRLTISGCADLWNVKLKAQGCSPVEGEVTLEKGYCNLHGEEEAINQAARLFLARCEAEEKGAILKTAAKTKKGIWHVSDEMAYRFPGERTDRRTK